MVRGFREYPDRDVGEARRAEGGEKPMLFRFRHRKAAAIAAARFWI